MSVTKALGTLNLVSARGLDNGPAGALKLANQAKSKQTMIIQAESHIGEAQTFLSSQTSHRLHEIEKSREANVKLKEKQKTTKPGRSFKSQEAMEQEKATSKWTSSKVNTDDTSS